MKVVGVILTILGVLLVAGGIRLAYTNYNLSQTHDLGKFIGGLAVSVVVLVIGLACLLRRRKAERGKP